MGVKEMLGVLGKHCMVTISVGSDSLAVPCMIVDARANYGRVDYEITPSGGRGETWVSSERVQIEQEA